MKKFLIVLAMVVTASLIMGAGCFIVNTGPVFTSTPGSTATVGTAYTYTPTAIDADADTVTFAVAGPTGMAISAGIITWTPTTAQIGTETVVVTASDGTNATAQTFTITVVAADEPEPDPVPVLVLVGIAVDPEDMDLIVEGSLGTDTETITSVTATYEVRGYDVDIALGDCLFLTSDSEVATVDENGLVTAEGVGTADILVKYGGKFATVAITVVAVELDHIVVLPETMTLDVEEFEAIDSVTAHYNDETKDEIYLGNCDYKSSDTDVAVVDGFFDWVDIFALSAGTADITVSYTEGEITKTDIVEVTVSEPEPVVPVAVTGVTLDQSTMTLTAGGATGTLVETVTPAGATDKSVTWASSNETFAVVAAGVVTSLNAGVVAITVTTVDGGFEDICVVTVTAEEEPPEKSEPPILISVPLALANNGYINETDFADGITVEGHAMVNSLIKVYINGVVVASTDYTLGVGGYENFVVSITEGELDVDGPKTVCATATQYGLAESDFSDEFEFTLDTTGPEIDTSSVGLVALTAIVTFTEAVQETEAETLGNWVLLNLTTGTSTFTITGADLEPSEVVELTFTLTGPHIAGETYSVTAANILDLAGNITAFSIDSGILGL